MDYNELFKTKTKQLAIDTIEVFSALPYTDAISVIRKQTIRSATSAAANYRAMCRARSDKERFAKLSIVIEEADETLFWLEITNELKLLRSETIEKLIEQATELVKVTSVYRKRLSSNH